MKFQTLTAPAAAMFTATAAHADCSIEPYRVVLGSPVTASGVTTDGDACIIGLRGAVETVAIVQEPRYGKARVDRQHRVIYPPKKRVVGQDSFELEACGMRGGRRACSTITRSIALQ